MTISPHTPIPVLRQYVWRTYVLQAMSCVPAPFLLASTGLRPPFIGDGCGDHRVRCHRLHAFRRSIKAACVLAQLDRDQAGDRAESPMKETLASIDAPHFNAGIVLWDDIVVEAAPIVGYMKKKKWPRDRVRSYCKEKGWPISVVHELERAKP